MKKTASATHTVTFQAKVAKLPDKCFVCGQSIPADNWYLVAKITTKIRKAVINTFQPIHDNEGVCKEVLLVKLYLSKPTFKSSMAMHYEEEY